MSGKNSPIKSGGTRSMRLDFLSKAFYYISCFFPSSFRSFEQVHENSGRVACLYGNCKLQNIRRAYILGKKHVIKLEIKVENRALQLDSVSYHRMIIVCFTGSKRKTSIYSLYFIYSLTVEAMTFFLCLLFNHYDY